MEAEEKKEVNVEELEGGLLRVTWPPKDVPIPKELEYLAGAMELPVEKTEALGKKRSYEFSYLFTKEGLWSGLVCPAKVWELAGVAIREAVL